MLEGHSGTTLLDAALEQMSLPGMPVDGPLGQQTSKDGRVTSPTVALNPRFVEALMGFPIGHVTRPLALSEMPLFRSVRKSLDG